MDGIEDEIVSIKTSLLQLKTTCETLEKEKKNLKIQLEESQLVQDNMAESLRQDI